MSDGRSHYPIRAHSGLTFSIHPLAHGAYQWVLSLPSINLVAAPPIRTHPSAGSAAAPKDSCDIRLRVKRAVKCARQSFNCLRHCGRRSIGMIPTHLMGRCSFTTTHHTSPTMTRLRRRHGQRADALRSRVPIVGSCLSLRDLFQAQLPSHMARWFFDKTRISDRDLCQWTGCSRGTLVQQRQRVAINTQPNEPISDPIELLNMDWSPGPWIRSRRLIGNAITDASAPPSPLAVCRNMQSTTQRPNDVCCT